MHLVIASFFGSGLLLRRISGSDKGSGTVGSLVALPLSLWVGSVAGWWAQLLGAMLIALASLWAVRAFEADGDAGWIVVDEAAGTFVATIGLLGWPAIAAFLVFRLADILKRPFPGVAEADSIPGAKGVTADDIVAGLYGLAAGHLLRAFLF